MTNQTPTAPDDDRDPADLRPWRADVDDADQDDPTDDQERPGGV